MAGEKYIAISCRNGSLLLNDFVEERYLPSAQKHKRSWKTDQRYLNQHILPYLGSYPLTEVSGQRLIYWLTALKKSGLSSSSRDRIFRQAKYILTCAVHRHILPGDTALRHNVSPKEKSYLPNLPTHEEAHRLLALIEEQVDRASAQAIYLLLLTGASKAEILNARWEDINFKRNFLVTEKTFTGRRRLIPPNNEAIRLIQTLPHHDDVPWLFSSRSGHHLASLHYMHGTETHMTRQKKLRIDNLRHFFPDFL